MFQFRGADERIRLLQQLQGTISITVRIRVVCLSEQAIEAAKANDSKLLLVIPKGFGDSLTAFKPSEIKPMTTASVP